MSFAYFQHPASGCRCGIEVGGGQDFAEFPADLATSVPVVNASATEMMIVDSLTPKREAAQAAASRKIARTAKVTILMFMIRF